MNSLLSYEEFLFESNISRKLSEEETVEREKVLKKTLHDFIEVCKKHKVRYWLDSGTLLGLYRDKRLIPGDSDADVGICIEDVTPEFLKSIGKNGAFPINPRSFFHVDDITQQLDKDEFIPIKCMKYVATKNDKPIKIKDFVWLDIYIYYPHKDEYLYRSASWYYKIPKDFVSKFGSMTRDGYTYSIPHKVEEYLEHQYGKGWVSPDPNYHSYSDPDRKNFVINADEFNKNGKYMWNFKTKEGKLVKE